MIAVPTAAMDLYFMSQLAENSLPGSHARYPGSLSSYGSLTRSERPQGKNPSLTRRTRVVYSGLF